MTDFSLFDILPNGVLIFKNKKIEYINQHLTDILSIGYFSRKNSVEIILRILNVKSEDDLFDFFINHDYFSSKKKVIQIEHSRHAEYDVFTFTLINDLLLKKDLQVNATTQKVYIDEKVAKHFKLNNIQKVNVLTFYKGVPIKNIGKIIRIKTDSIEVVVNSKHSISLLERDDILLMMNTKKGASVLHGSVVDHNKNTFTIKNFYLSNDDMHLRNGLRVKSDNNMIINVNEQNFRVYDISTRGISIYISSTEEEELLKSTKSAKLFLDDKVLNLSMRYLKTITENDKILKIVFIISSTENDKSILNQYIVNKQNKILREIHDYVE
ncbi:MAG: hypothetical protein OQK48_01345 [Sulfurimonas sp.]|uniref:hypothetical protein n=1 Tax=Sulfurimonas sp. TaxID=2022749 RepID=UPI002607A328|nr:hypothetical protein [Sulfurimonas sp.]MCW8894983.1 hypothetical protein [Sulfurimonas sp.]MCW8953567.1 hypothetical protein [Sulfurimonas sp.]MCW9066861.1 hypothetical protein [Sulfurimonas sp.]